MTSHGRLGAMTFSVPAVKPAGGLELAFPQNT